MPQAATVGQKRYLSRNKEINKATLHRVALLSNRLLNGVPPTEGDRELHIQTAIGADYLSGNIGAKVGG